AGRQRRVASLRVRPRVRKKALEPLVPVEASARDHTNAGVREGRAVDRPAKLRLLQDQLLQVAGQLLPRGRVVGKRVSLPLDVADPLEEGRRPENGANARIGL